jgi:hypothetical protein
VKSGVRDRFVTRLANYLQNDAESRERYTSAILEDAALLRKEGGFYLVLDAVAALLSADPSAGPRGGSREGASEPPALAGEIMDSLLAHYLALRISTELDVAARAPMIRIASAFPSLAAPALTEILVESSDREARRVMREILLGLGGEGRLAALGLLRDPRWSAVRDGVRILADTGDPGMVQALTVVLAHSDRRVRKEAVIALARIGGEDAGLLLLGMLNDPQPDVREVAALGVGGLRVIRAIRPLLEMVATEGEEEVLAQVLLALGELGDPGAVPAIEKKAVGSIFNRPPRSIRVAAYRALAAIGTPHARALVEAGWSDKDPEVRQEVGKILRHAGSEARDIGSAESEDPPHSVE